MLASSPRLKGQGDIECEEEMLGKGVFLENEQILAKMVIFADANCK